MTYASNFGGERHRFADLRDVLAKASHRRSGDELAGIAAASDAQRVAARAVLADLPLRAFLDEPLVSYETDEVTRLIFDTHVDIVELDVRQIGAKLQRVFGFKNVYGWRPGSSGPGFAHQPGHGVLKYAEAEWIDGKRGAHGLFDSYRVNWIQVIQLT